MATTIFIHALPTLEWEGELGWLVSHLDIFPYIPKYHDIYNVTPCWQFEIKAIYFKQLTPYCHSENEVILLL